MYGWDRQMLRQCVIVYRKHTGRQKTQPFQQISRHYSGSGKYTKLGNLYARLGLQSNATQAEIKEAYYKLSKEYHPDRNVGKSDMSAKFRSVAEAYEILGNQSTKAEYDKETPYHRMIARRSRHGPSPTGQRYQSSDKDDDLVDKIRFYQEIMNKRAKRPSGGHTFNAGDKRFDYDAWQDAHYTDRNERWTEANFRNFRSRDPFDMGGPVPPGYPQGNPYRLRPQRPRAWHPPASAEPHLRKEREANMEKAFRQLIVMLTMMSFVILVMGMIGFNDDPRVPLRRPPSHDRRPTED